MENRYKSMPSMLVSEKEKNDELSEQVLNSITIYMSTGDSIYNSSKLKDIRNYQIYN